MHAMSLSQIMIAAANKPNQHFSCLMVLLCLEFKYLVIIEFYFGCLHININESHPPRVAKYCENMPNLIILF